MRKYYAHIFYFSLLTSILVVGFIGKVLPIAAFFGAVTGAATDPLLIIGAAAIGGACLKQRTLLFSSLIFAILLSAVIAHVNAVLGASFSVYLVMVRFVAILSIAYVVNAIRLIPEKTQTSELSTSFAKFVAAARSSIRKVFRNEEEWRIFIVLQVVGILLVMYVDITNVHYWDFLPEIIDHRNKFSFSWDLFRQKYWTRNQENWFALAGMIGPFLITKAVTWVRAAKSNGDKLQDKQS